MQEPVLSPGHHSPVIAAIDLGSNSFHMIVARIADGTLQPLHKNKIRVQLAEGLDEYDKLSKDAMQRGLDALQSFSYALEGFENTAVRIIATHTLRKARNAQKFIRQARRILPYPIEVVSGEEEARLIYQGVAHTQVNDGLKLVMDIGGGSTEIVVGEGFNPNLLRSLNMGCVTFSEKYFPNGKLKEKHFHQAYMAAMEKLELPAQHFANYAWRQCFGTSGTNNAVFQLAQNMFPDDEGLSYAQLQKLRKHLLTFDHIEQIELEGIAPERARTLPGGLAILMALFDSLKIKQMQLSDAALREGVLYDMDDRLQHEDIRLRSVDSLAKRYYVDHSQANRVTDTARSFLEQVKYDWKLDGEELSLLLCSATLLHEVGIHIHTKNYQRHSAYILQHTDLPGFSQLQQDVLVTLVEHCRKSLKGPFNRGFDQIGRSKVIRLCCLIRLSVLLHSKRRDNFLPHMGLSANKKALRLSMPEGWLDDKPSLAAALQKEVNYLKKQHLDLQLLEHKDQTL